MNFPPLGKPDLGPLNKLCDSMLQNINDALKTNLPAEYSELLSNLQAALKSDRDEVVKAFAKDFPLMEAEYADTTTAIKQMIEEEFPRLQKQLEDVPALIESEQAKAAITAAGILASVPKPPPPPTPISINPGEELAARLMELGAPAKPPSKTMPSPGNIWENWKPGQGNS